MHKPILHCWNVGNAYIRYCGSNINHGKIVSYQKVRLMEIQKEEKKELFLIIPSFNNKSLAINIRWFDTYEFKNENWVLAERIPSFVSDVMVSNNEVFIRGNFSYENEISPKQVYAERHEIDAIFPVNTKLIGLLQSYEIELADFRQLFN